MDELDFVRYISTKSSLRSVNSRRHCLCRYRIFINWLSINKLKITKDSIEEFLYQLSQKHSNHNTLNTYINFLRQLGYYFKDRGIKINAFDGLKSYPKYRPPIIILSPEEVERIIHVNTIKKHYDGAEIRKLQFTLQTMRMFLAYSGCRYDEAASLPVKNVDLGNGRVIFDHTKNKTNRNIFITSPLIQRLEQLVKGKSNLDLVFTNLRGKKMLPQDFGDDLHYAAKLSGITKRVHPHLFRHTYGTHLYIATKDIGLVQLVLGHKDIKSTMIYIHLADEHIKKGMHRHPFIRDQIDPKEFILGIEESLKSFKLEEDERFDYLKVKNTINEFISKLYQTLKKKN